MQDRIDFATSEKFKYERMWQHSVYRDNHVSVTHADFFIDHVSMPIGSTVFDIGCGSGVASRRFADRGMRPLCADIASNALDESNSDLPFLRCEIWDIPGRLIIDYGFCRDMMEHIPPDHVNATLASIRSAVTKDVYFNISLREDVSGRLIGETLHLTVRPLEWWLDALNSHWSNVRVVSTNEANKSATLLTAP